MSKPENQDEVLEQNVSSLLESGGEPPKISDVARARIRKRLMEAHGGTEVAMDKASVKKSGGSRWLAAGAGLVAAAAAVAVVAKVATRTAGPRSVPTAKAAENALADGTTWTAGPGGKVTVVGDRHVRVEGAVLLDVAGAKGSPFTVDTANGTIKVLGTRFLVDAAIDVTTAAVVRGVVELATGDGKVTLHAGEQGVAEKGRPPTRGPAPRLTSLVSWAAAARKKDETGTTPVRNGTLFARDPNHPWIPEAPLPIAKLGVDVVVENQVARVAIDQTFTNTAPQTMEGMYRFAIPPDAALQRLAMYVNGKLTESAVVERMRARRIYEDAVYRQVDPALLEWAGTGRLALRVYPLNPREDKRLVLAYTQSIPKLYDDYTLAVPLPEVDLPVGQLDFHVRVANCASCEIASPSQQVTTKVEGNDAIVTYSQANTHIGDSLVLHVRDSRRDAKVATADGFLMVRARPELPTAQRTYKPHTWVILDDVSASRGKLELKAQADLVDGFLRELDEDDRVAVVAFDTAPRTALELTRVDDVKRQDVRAALNKEGGIGATDLAAALAKAETMLSGVAPEDASIVYLGDGVITAGARELDRLRTGLVGRAQFVGVGIGDGPDTQTLDALAAATGGYATTIDLADDVGWRAFDLVAALHTARAVGVTASLVDSAGKAVEATAYLGRAQVADGEELELVAKLGTGAPPVAVELNGSVDGQPWHQRIALAKADGVAGYLPRLWAQRHIAARMLAKHEAVDVPPCAAGAATCPDEAELREARDEGIRKEVVALGKQYFLLSRHTSLLVLEDDDMYRKYDVEKGAGDTWAPYMLPPTIAVTSSAPPAVAVPTTAELVRSPLQLFYDYSAYMGGYGYGLGRRGMGMGGGGWDDVQTRPMASAGPWNAQQPMEEKSKSDAPMTVTTISATSPTTGSATEATPPPPPASPEPAAKEAEMPRDHMTDTKTSTSLDLDGESDKRACISTDELQGRATAAGELGDYGIEANKKGACCDFGGGTRKSQKSAFAMGTVAPQHLMYPMDYAFADLTGFVPGLAEDGADRWRADLEEHGGNGKHTLDAAARDRLAAARTALPAGVYRWGDFEIAVDAARHIGWHRTTSANLAETASFDGTTLVRRYPELGLDVTRAFAEDDVALALAYLPVWIAEPAHYARYFDVTTSGATDVALSRTTAGASHVAYVLAFDDAHHLTAIRDGAGHVLVAVTWSSAGPTAVTVGGDAVDVGFSSTPVGDAVTWAHGATTPGVEVALPGHLAAYWTEQIAKLQVGSAEWRHAQRQNLASLAAISNASASLAALQALAKAGGLELGDIVLGSIGMQAADAKERAALLAPVATTPVGRYLAVDVSKNQPSKEILPTAGLVGALWSLRDATMLVQTQQLGRAADRVMTIDSRAVDLKVIGAALVGNNYNAKPEDIVRVWDAAATGPYRNVARAAAASALGNRGNYDLAAERIAQLCADLDLRATPPQLAQLQYLMTYSKRGQAGWQLAFGQARDKVLASDSFDHVIALAMSGTAQPAQAQALLDKAAALAAGNPDRLIQVAMLGMSTGQTAWVQGIIEPALKATPTRELHQLAAQIAMMQSRNADALVHLEAAHDLADPDAPITVQALRMEMGQIVGLAGSVAAEQPVGAGRDAAKAHVMAWATKWRELDPDNSNIDEIVGGILLRLGDTTEAWRQLSTIIEHDPMSGDGYQAVAQAYETNGRVNEAIDLWQQALVLDQTNPTPRFRKAQALNAVGRTAEGEALLKEIAGRKWHARWSGVVYQVQAMLGR